MIYTLNIREIQDKNKNKNQVSYLKSACLLVITTEGNII